MNPREEIIKKSRELVSIGLDTIQVGDNEAEVYSPDELGLDMPGLIAGLAFSEEGLAYLYLITESGVVRETRLFNGREATAEEAQKEPLSYSQIDSLLAKLEAYYAFAISQS